MVANDSFRVRRGLAVPGDLRPTQHRPRLTEKSERPVNGA